MPIYEYECLRCGKVEDKLYTSVQKAENIAISLCSSCGGVTKKIISSPNFRVVGFNAKNGYNLPNYDDVVDADGYKKERWGKN